MLVFAGFPLSLKSINTSKQYQLNLLLNAHKKIFGNKTLTKDIQISYEEDWVKNHWKALESAYMHAPYFEHYGIEIYKLISSKEKSLINLNQTIFKNFKYRNEYISRMLKNYVYLNPGLTIIFNGEKFFSENGLKDLLSERINENDMLYPIVHISGEDIEVAITHSKTQYSEEYHSFVNGQNTTQGGTHLAALKIFHKTT